MSAKTANESSPARDPAPPAGRRWRRFRRPSHLPGGRRRLAPHLSWHDLLNRRDALVLDIRSRQSASLAETILVALIDTTGAPRLVAGTGDGLDWPELHGHLVEALETAGVVLAWDVPPKAQLLGRIARSRGLSLPEIPWRDLRADYGRFGYPGDSLAAAAKRHVNAAHVPGPLGRCQLALAVMTACGR